MSGCPDSDALFDFAAGEPCAAEVGAHVASCAECAGLVDDARDLIRTVESGVVVVLSPADAAQMDLFREALRSAATGVHTPVGVLQAFVTGALTPTGEELVAAHVCGCLPCAMALADLAREARWDRFMDRLGLALGLDWAKNG